MRPRVERGPLGTAPAIVKRAVASGPTHASNPIQAEATMGNTQRMREEPGKDLLQRCSRDEVPCRRK